MTAQLLGKWIWHPETPLLLIKARRKSGIAEGQLGLFDAPEQAIALKPAAPPSGGRRRSPTGGGYFTNPVTGESKFFPGGKFIPKEFSESGETSEHFAGGLDVLTEEPAAPEDLITLPPAEPEQAIAEPEPSLHDRVMALTAELKNISMASSKDFGKDMTLGKWEKLKATAEELHRIADNLHILNSVAEPVLYKEQLRDIIDDAIAAGDEVEYMGSKNGAFGGSWDISLKEGGLRISDKKDPNGRSLFQVKFGSSWIDIPESHDAGVQAFTVRKSDGSEQQYALQKHNFGQPGWYLTRHFPAPDR